MDVTHNNNKMPDIVPSLKQWQSGDGYYSFPESLCILFDTNSLDDNGSLKDIAYNISQMLLDITGLASIVQSNSEISECGIVLVLSEENSDKLGLEGYEINIDTCVEIKSPTLQGILYGGITLAQMLLLNKERRVLPKGHILDYPSYSVRAGMLDLGRRFMSMDYVKEIAYYMAWFKLNELHLHINDNGGDYTGSFLIESKRFPQINSNNLQFMWTQNEYRFFQKELIKWNITVVTEIDTPGHSKVFAAVDSSFIKEADLDLDNPATVAFVKELYDEFLDGEDPVIQSGIFHIGTDESFHNTNENQRAYTDMMIKYASSKKNINEVRVWGNLSYCKGETPVTNKATVQIWDTPFQRVDEAISDGYSVINSTSCMLYIVPGNGDGGALHFNDYRDPAELYDIWGGPSDFTTHTLEQGVIFYQGVDYYAEYNIAPGHPQLRGAEFCIWNDTAGGFSDYDIFDRFRSMAVVMAEKSWNGEDNRYTDGISFKQAVKHMDIYVPCANPGRYIESRGSVVAAYDFAHITNNIVKDTSGNNYDAKINDTSAIYLPEEHRHALQLNESGYIALPFDGIPSPLTVSFDLYLSSLPLDDCSLFEGRDGKIFINSENGSLDFIRNQYEFTFGYNLPVNQWIHIDITCHAPHYPGRDETTLAVNGTVIGNAMHMDGTTPKSTSIVLPTAIIGLGIKGYLCNLIITNQYKFDA